MIKDILLRLNGTAGDFARLAAVRRIAAGLLFNVLPAAISDLVQDAGSSGPAKLPHDARKAGDAVEATALQRLERLQQPTFFRRFDVEGERDVADTASLVPPIPSWRFALNGQPNEPRGLIEELLYGAGRHLFLVPDDEKTMAPSITSWLPGTEAGNLRALCPNPSPICSERGKFGFSWWNTSGRPRPMAEEQRCRAASAASRHQRGKVSRGRGGRRNFRHRDRRVPATGRRPSRDGSYGHSRLHVFLPGSTTSRLLHHSPVPLVIAH
ncbi:hypothetical protein ACVIWU_005818 [Bradyrhizobium sp. USDA 4509]|nr:hypothetical protein [Bradyrhizobium elkanii]